VKKVAFLLLCVGVYFACRYEKPARWRGLPAPADPIQTSDKLPPPFSDGDFVITPLARYSITAVVLSRERYRFDDGAALSPLDLALGWGSMSIAGVVNDLQMSQGGRFYEYQWKESSPLEPDQIISHSANTHCLPANAQVRRQLLSVKRHDLVTMEGYLVEARGANGSVWRSSLTRDDDGGGACEVMWVTSCSSHQL
jgi:hypothetical protein